MAMISLILDLHKDGYTMICRFKSLCCILLHASRFSRDNDCALNILQSCFFNSGNASFSNSVAKRLKVREIIRMVVWEQMPIQKPARIILPHDFSCEFCSPPLQEFLNLIPCIKHDSTFFPVAAIGDRFLIDSSERVFLRQFVDYLFRAGFVF